MAGKTSVRSRLYKGNYFTAKEFGVWDPRPKTPKFKEGRNAFVKVKAIDREKNPDGYLDLRAGQDIDLVRDGLIVQVINVEYKRVGMHEDIATGSFTGCRKWFKRSGKRTENAGPEPDSSAKDEEQTGVEAESVPDEGGMPEQEAPPEQEAKTDPKVENGLVNFVLADDNDRIRIATPDEAFALIVDQVIATSGRGSGKGTAVHTVVEVDGERKEVEGYIAPDDGSFDLALLYGRLRFNALYTGSAGCGKTITAKAVADALELWLVHVPLSEAKDELFFTGKPKVYVDENGERVTGTEDTIIKQALRGDWKRMVNPATGKPYKGCIVVFDEFDAMDPNVGVFVQMMISDRILNTEDESEPVIHMDKDTFIVCIANTVGLGADHAYVGRNQLDRATMDRLKATIITFDYNSTVEEAIVCEHVLAWGREMRKVIEEKQMDRWVSTRALKMLSEVKSVTEAGRKKNKSIPADQWVRSYFADWNDSDKALVPTPLKKGKVA